LAAVLLPGLRWRIAGFRRGLDPHAIDAAADMAAMVYFQAPNRFDPNRAPLLGWLATVGINAVKREWLRTGSRPTAARTLGLEVPTDATSVDATDLVEEAECAAERARQRAILFRLAVDEGERAFLAARAAGASIEEQAAALGLGEGLAAGAQKGAVARAWNRILHRARRRGLSSKR
jgi:hypothetical protein